MQSWQPACDISALKARAELLKRLRSFFYAQNILEVETPIVCRDTVTAIHINSFKLAQGGGHLQTSPEYAMKRLLVSGSGSIFQICKAFRQAERGTQHNSEFTMLEWYCVDMDYRALQEQVTSLLLQELGDLAVIETSYRDAFIKYAHIDPFNCDDEALKAQAEQYIEFQFDAFQRDDYLDLILSHCVQPQLGFTQSGERALCVMYDFPATQAALASTAQKDYGEVAQRFEVYVEGLELANAYQELTAVEELKQRWQQDRDSRLLRGLPNIDMDQRLLSAMEAGLPDCSGVALGVDRLLMLKLNKQSIDDVLPFPDERA